MPCRLAAHSMNGAPMIKNDRKSSALTAMDLAVVARWCQTRRCRTRMAAGLRSVLVIETLSQHTAWQRLALAKLGNLYRLSDEWGDTLAEASSLSVVLDAVDGGVATPLHTPLMQVAATTPVIFA